MSIVVEPCRYPDAVFLYEDRANANRLPHILNYDRKEGVRVKKDRQELTVHCFFTEEGENLQELISQSLRLFIERNLQKYAIF